MPFFAGSLKANQSKEERIDYEKCGIKHVCAYEFVIPLTFDSFWTFQKGLTQVELNGKYGFINKKGKIIIPPKFDWYAWDGFKGGLASVFLNRKYGFINKKGELVIPFKFTRAFSFSEGLAIVSLGEFFNRKWGGGYQQKRRIFINCPIFRDSPV